MIVELLRTIQNKLSWAQFPVHAFGMISKIKHGTQLCKNFQIPLHQICLGVLLTSSRVNPPPPRSLPPLLQFFPGWVGWGANRAPHHLGAGGAFWVSISL